MEPIHIDLRNLSQEHLAQCAPHMGTCLYSGPCVIGTLIPPAQRLALAHTLDLDNGCVYDLLQDGVLTAPKNQHGLAVQLQQAFDQGDVPLLHALVQQAMALPADPAPASAPQPCLTQ